MAQYHDEHENEYDLRAKQSAPHMTVEHTELIARLRAYGGNDERDYRHRAATAIETLAANLAQVERERDEGWRFQSEVSKAIGSARWMDPPDGGDVTLPEQVGRMRSDLEAAEAKVAKLEEALGRVDSRWVNFVNCRADPTGDKITDYAEEQANIKALGVAVDTARNALKDSP